MFFKVESIKVNGATTASTTTAIDLAYCVKPSRPAWFKAGNYSNAGIDSLVVTFNPTEATDLAKLAKGDKVTVKINGVLSAVEGLFDVVELTRESSTSHKLYFMPAIWADAEKTTAADGIAEVAL